MDQGINRRQFLRGDIRNISPTFRPPWSSPESDFLAICDQCGDCLSACETGILERGDGGYPQVNFHNGECSFCAACVNSCQTGALAQHHSNVPWQLHAIFDTENCLASRGVMCLVCGEHCITQAIHFPRTTFAIGTPILNQATCTGCGACVATCPANAIRMTMETN